MKLLTLLPFLLFLFSRGAFAQPSETFLGTAGNDRIAQMVPASDGNFFAVGSKNVGQFGQVWLQKLDPTGQVLWEKTYPTVGADKFGFGHNVTVLADGNLIITGEERVDQTFNQSLALAIKTDANGNALWKRTYAEVSAVFDAVQSGNNYYLVGWADYTGSTDGGLMMLVNGTGILQWKQPLNVFNQTRVKRIFPTPDGNYLLIGRSNVIGVGFEGVFIRKVAPDATQIWERTVNTEYREENYYFDMESFYNQPLGVAQAHDGSYWITNPSGYYADITLIHISTEGVVLSQHNYGGATFNEYPYSIASMPDGGWLITGEAQTSTAPVESQGFAMRLDAGGLELWRNYYGAGNATERLFSGLPLSNGALLLAGMSDNVDGGSHGGQDGWLLSVEENGNWLPWKIQCKVVIDLNQNCIADAGEPPATGWFVEVKDTATRLMVTDGQGSFQTTTGDGTLTFTVVVPEPAGDWVICNNNQMITSNAQNPVDDLTFLVSPADPSCPKTEVSMTQPDLVRCETGTFYITVRNSGTGTSNGMLLEMSLDPALHITDASEPFGVGGNHYYFQILPMDGLSQKIISVDVNLSCDVPIGATHAVMARLAPIDCAGNSTESWFSVEGHCNGNTVGFVLQNNDAGGPSANTRYRVLADDLIAVDYTDVVLPAGGAPVTVSFPADGRTWRLELEEGGGPLYRHPAAAVEGCGTGTDGLASIGFENAWRFEETAPDIAAILAANTTGVPAKVEPATRGFGRYHLIGDRDALEFTARINNPLPVPAQEVEFRLSVSATLDVRSFEAVAYNAPVQISMDNNGVLHVRMTGLNLLAGEAAMVRFRLRPMPNVPADSAQYSLLLVEAEAYFNQSGPYALSPGYLNYSTSFPLSEDVYNNYPPEVFRFGGRSFDFGTSAANAPDGSVFLVGESASFSENYDAWLIKTDASGKAYWQAAYDLGDQGLNTFRSVVPLPDGGCLAAGNYRPPTAVNNYITDYYAYLARIDANGKMLWHKKFRPGGKGAWAGGMIPSGDGNYVMFGYGANGESGIDQFYLKVDENGAVLWTVYDSTDGSAFKPERAVQTADGGLVFLGSNQSTITDNEVYLEKIDANGNKVWATGFNPTNSIFLLGGCLPAPDGGFIVSASAQWNDGTNYVITPGFFKFSATGDFLWEKNPVAGPFGIAYSYNLLAAPGGGFFSVGEVFADTMDHYSDVMLCKVDDNGDILWWKNYGARNTEWAEVGLVTASNDILLWGFNQDAPPLYDLQGVLVRTDLNGDLLSGNRPEPKPNPVAVVIYPNPAHEVVHVRVPNRADADTGWQIIDLAGRVVARGRTGGNRFDIPVAQLAPGSYFLQLPEWGIVSKCMVVL